MQFPSIVGDDQSEVAFVRVQNVSGATRAAGDAVVWDITAPNGVRVSVPATATLSLFCGTLVKSLANLEYGLAQCWGFSTTSKVLNDPTTAVAAGDTLVPVNGQVHLVRSGVGDGKSGFVNALEVYATATTPVAALKKVFIRAM